MYLRFKRAIDLLLAVTLLVLLLPLILLVTLAVRISLGSPVFYTQVRPGKDGQPFNLVKFRSMSDDRDSSGALLPDDMRITALGRFLRASSVDELPELVNVVKGDMSLVGPRPLLMEYLPLYNQEQARRHCLRPGITGHAQVNGRNTLSWDDKFTLDSFYVDNVSLILDAKILWKTILVVLLRQGITDKNLTVGMERFRGNSAKPID